MISKQSGMASSYDCYTDQCPLFFTGQVSISPGSLTEAVGTTTYCPAIATFEDDNNYYYFVDESSLSTWNSSNSGIASASGGYVSGESPGTSTISGTYDGCVGWANQIVCECGSFQPGTGSSTVNVVQVPAVLKVVNTQTSSYCSGTSCLLEVWYRVLDGSGVPIQIPGMRIAEAVSGTETGNCTGTLQDQGSWNTDSTGTMSGPDYWWWCCDSGCNATYSFNQTFTVDGYSVQVENGSYAGSHNVVTIQCSNGQGTCPSVVPTP